MIILDMRDITIIQTKLGESSVGWKQKKSVVSVTKNWILAWLAGKMLGSSNQFFYKKMGVKIGKNVHNAWNKNGYIFS